MNKYIVFLVFIFLCLNVKAEFFNSAFTATSGIQETIDNTNKKKYELAKILFEDKQYGESLKILLKLVDVNFKDKFLEAKVNLLIGRLLNNYIDNREAKQIKILDEKINKIKAVKFLNKSLLRLTVLEGNIELNQEKDFNFVLAQNYISLSYSFLQMRKNDSSRYYIKKLVNLKSIDNRILTLKSQAYLNLGRLFVFERNLKEAENSFLKSIDISEMLSDKMSLVSSLNNLGNIYAERKEYEKAKKTYDKTLKYIENENSISALENKELIYDNIAWALYNLKDYKAYKYVTESYAIRDSLNENKLKRDLAKIEAENDVDLVQRIANEKQSKLERKNWIIGIVGVVVSLLLLFLANLYKLRQRNLSLKLSQNELRQQRKLDRLKSQTQIKILNATIDGKETERKQIAETLHDNVSALLSSANMHLQASQKQFGGVVPLELQKTQQIIAEASQKIRDLSHNLISSVLLKFGLEYAVKDLAKKFSNSSIKINTAIHNVHRYSEECEIKVFNIIQELVNNILKHSKAENAYIMIEEEEGKLNIIVKDDGEGFVEKSSNETGIGLNHIKARINIMKGHFLLETAIGEGTKVIMNIPVVKKREMVIA